jgi:anti-sigma regulatory factor (Ser/Thr protein kinase)
MVWAKTMAAAKRQRGKIVAETAVRLSPASGIALAGHGPGLACAASLKLGAAPGSARAAREFTAAVLRIWDLAVALPDAQLVVSELVTNAIRHGLATAGAPSACGPTPAEPPIGLRLLRHSDGLRFEVSDPSDIMPARLVRDDDADFGRGLCLIGAISHQWGVNPLPAGGKCVWADLCLPP